MIGIVADTRLAGLDRTPQAQVYVPAGSPQAWPLFLFVRTAVPPLRLAASVRREIAAIRPGQAAHLMAALDDLLSASVAERRFAMLLLTGFGLIAVALAAAGIYGAISYSIAQRTGEIGIRVALGASPRAASRPAWPRRWR